MKQLDRPLPPNGVGRYDETRFRDSLRTLGLFPPVELAEVHRAYKTRARRIHPDRFVDPAERAAATRKIQEINAARDYVARHFRSFDLMQRTRYRTGGRNEARPESRRGWTEWALLPVTALYALTTLIVAAPLLAIRALLRGERPRAWRARIGVAGVAAWRAWLVLAPHVALLAVFLLAGADAVQAWVGVSMLVMAAGDIATLVTGDPNELRRHRPVARARSIAEGALTPA